MKPLTIILNAYLLKSIELLKIIEPKGLGLKGTELKGIELKGIEPSAFYTCYSPQSIVQSDIQHTLQSKSVSFHRFLLFKNVLLLGFDIFFLVHLYLIALKKVDVGFFSLCVRDNLSSYQNIGAV